jgi:hypothetical protein
MDALLNLRWLNGRSIALILALLVAGGGFAVLSSLSPEAQTDLLWFVQDYLPIAMFITLALLLFSGYPVAFIKGKQNPALEFYPQPDRSNPQQHVK